MWVRPKWSLNKYLFSKKLGLGSKKNSPIVNQFIQRGNPMGSVAY